MVIFTAAVPLDRRSGGWCPPGTEDAGWPPSLETSRTVSGWRDLNPRPPAPKAGALPSCATPRGGPSLGGTAQRSRDGQGRRTYRRPMTRPAVGEMVLEDARALFDACRWRDCVTLLSEADAQAPLDGAGLALLAEAAYLIGADEQAVTAYARAYQWFLRAGDVPAAARSALSNCFALENAGDAVRSGAWGARAERLVEEHGLADSAAAGWLLSRRSHEMLKEQRVEEALATAREAERVSLAAGEPDAAALSRLTIGFA